MKSVIQFIIYVTMFQSYSKAWQSSADYKFKAYTSKPVPMDGEESSGYDGFVNGHFKTTTTHSSRTTSYSSDDSGSEKNTFESTTYCSVDEQFEELRSRLSVLEAQLNKEREDHCCATEQFIGFTVYLSRSKKSTPGNIIKFDHVILNEGGGYDSFRGKFTVPVSGYYSLSYHVTSDEITNCNVRLVVDGAPTLSTVIKQRNNVSQHCNGGNSGIIKLFQGQHVWVESSRDIHTIQGGYEDHVTTFSGALLRRI